MVPLDGLEHRRLFPRAQDGTRDVHPASVFVVHDDLRQSIGIAERHRPQKERVDDGEHGGRDADAEAEHPDGREAGHRARAQAANRMPDILSHAIRERLPPDVADRFLHRVQASQRDARRADRFFARQATRHVLCDGSLEVFPQLVVQRLLLVLPVEQAAQPAGGAPQQGHHHSSPSEACRMRAIAAACTSQSRVPCLSRARPGAVRL